MKIDVETRKVQVIFLSICFTWESARYDIS